MTSSITLVVLNPTPSPQIIGYRTNEKQQCCKWSWKHCFVFFNTFNLSEGFFSMLLNPKFWKGNFMWPMLMEYVFVTFVSGPTLCQYWRYRLLFFGRLTYFYFFLTAGLVVNVNVEPLACFNGIILINCYTETGFQISSKILYLIPLSR